LRTARTPGIGRLASGGVAAAVAISTALTASASDRHHGNETATRHVLLISVDGLHQTDLAWYITQHPQSALASLVRGGTQYTNALTPVPSDSFPGLIGQVTGGDPAVTGVYYDVSYDGSLLPPGTTSCPKGAALGTPVTYDESLDANPAALDAGQGLPSLPGDILSMTGQPRSLINPANLPVNPSTCKPVYPHQFLRVNTVFEVAREHGLRTAWSDKHPAYEILNGPSGAGVQDLFTPEINSDAPAGGDWTTDNAATIQYDSYKVQSVLNEIDGLDHSGRQHVGVPGIFGLNFQSVSTAEKLPTSDGLTGGYLPGGAVPSPLLSRALDFINAQVGALTTEIWAQGIGNTTTIILSAKHGQSPKDPALLTRIPDGPLLDGLNAAWKSTHPTAPDLVASATDDDAMIVWLSDHSQAAADFAKNYLLAQSGVGNDINGNPTPFTAAGLAQVYAGKAAADFFHATSHDPHTPDLYATVQHGVVFTGKKAKIAEHGGAQADDRAVPLVVAGPQVAHQATVTAPVETTQIAPTILRLLGIDPSALKAVRIEHTPALPLS
jgi:Type I phosphodiesterase / nucleotide pyrophosphatase